MTTIIRLGILLLFTAGVFVVHSCDRSTATADAGLRDAMQERMQDVVRLREAWDRGEPMERMEFARFAGLPHSEFVDDVSEYQVWFEAFDDMYEAIFSAENPAKQFNLVIQNCAACHRTVCPGPLRSITRLEIPMPVEPGGRSASGTPITSP
jgi:hypothetical protein